MKKKLTGVALVLADVAVSYTHLDVYKRQTLSFWIVVSWD